MIHTALTEHHMIHTMICHMIHTTPQYIPHDPWPFTRSTLTHLLWFLSQDLTPKVPDNDDPSQNKAMTDDAHYIHSLNSKDITKWKYEIQVPCSHLLTSALGHNVHMHMIATWVQLLECFYTNNSLLNHSLFCKSTRLSYCAYRQKKFRDLSIKCCASHAYIESVSIKQELHCS